MLDDVDVDIDDHADGGGGDDAQPDPVIGLSIRILSNCARIRPRFHCLESKQHQRKKLAVRIYLIGTSCWDSL